MKFKVGDRVKIVGNANIGPVDFKDGRIIKIDTDDLDAYYKLDIDDGNNPSGIWFPKDSVCGMVKKDATKIDEKRHCIETLMDAFEMHQDANIEFAIESVMRDYFKAVKE